MVRISFEAIISRKELSFDLGEASSGLYYNIYNVIFMPSYRSKDVSVESID